MNRIFKLHNIWIPNSMSYGPFGYVISNGVDGWASVSNVCVWSRSFVRSLPFSIGFTN
jgi:hypothetical protein